MMKYCLAFATMLFSFAASAQNSHPNYLSDIITKADIRKNQGYLVVSANCWRYDTCLYSKQLCKYNTSQGMNVRINSNNSKVSCELLRGNNSGYQSKNPYDTFQYSFVPTNLNVSQFIRTLLIKDSYLKKDTFNLTALDTLLFDNHTLIKKVFGKSAGENLMPLNIYVFKSVDSFGSTMLHYWVEMIGVIKLTDEKCWRYSFEIKDDRNKSIKKMYDQILSIIKKKYQDPYWSNQPCGVE